MKASVVHETVLPNETSVAVLNPTEIPARQKEERFLAAKRIDRPSSPRLNLELKPLKPADTGAHACKERQTRRSAECGQSSSSSTSAIEQTMWTYDQAIARGAN